MTIETLIAIWGASLSSGLAILKVREVINERPRLTTSYNFSHPEHGGNRIIVENASPTPAMISYWELELRKRTKFRLKTIDLRLPDEDCPGFIIGAYSNHMLHFTEQEYFEWGAPLDGATWYLKLHIVGRRRPVTLRVYRNN